MTRPQSPWTFEGEPSGQRNQRRPRLVWALLGVGVVVLVIVGSVIWLARPTPVVQEQTSVAFAVRPLLNEQPPTVIENAIDKRSLYPPGFVNYDSSLADPNRGRDADPSLEYETTSEPPDCDGNPLIEAELNIYGTDKERYSGYPVSISMYPADDPGGRKEDSERFSVSIYPAQDPNSLKAIRDEFARCDDAQLTTTVTRNGQVVEQTTKRKALYLTDAPSSVASESFALNRRDRDICSFYGLVRGMMVHVTCPAEQKEAGAQLFRTATLRVYDV